jgi:hypothetical protein
MRWRIFWLAYAELKGSFSAEENAERDALKGGAVV